MKITFNTTSRFFYSIAISLIVSVSLVAGAWAEEKEPKGSIAFLPLSVHSSKDISYLREGVRDMLASRLASSAGVEVIDKAKVDSVVAGSGKITPEMYPEIAGRLQADYLVAGSLTALGGSVSLDAKVYSAERQEDPSSFFVTAQKEDEVIAAVDQLAWDIAEKIFAQSRPVLKTQQTQAAGLAGGRVSGMTTTHPERAFVHPSGSMYGGAPIVRPMGITGAYGFTKTQNFSLNLQAMDIGDVNGDGQDEVVLAGRNEVRVYQRSENRLTLFRQFPVLARFKVHYITLADLNENGIMEIYVSAADKKEPNSFAVEWQGKGFEYLFQDARWYVKALHVPGEDKVLAGQRASVNAPIKPGIHLLELKNGELQKVRQLSLPDSVNVFDFTYADLDGDRNEEIIVITQNDSLKVLSQSGQNTLWISDDHYGGTTKYIGEVQKLIDPSHEKTGMDYDETVLDRIYIPSRILITDINNDGMQDVVINKNLSTASRVFRNYKSYPSGEIHGLTWNGIALTELWRTRKIDGYIADYQLKMNEDQQGGQLFVGLILRGKGMDFMSSKRSTVLTYQLDFSEAEKKE